MAVQLTATGKKLASNSKKAPAQYSQPSRKGKKAWRKNVDIVDVEEGMEQLRDEERVTGSTLHSKSNNELFQIDTTGDDKIRRSLPKFDSSQLSYTKLIAQRSAIAAVYSRPSSSPSTVKKQHVTLNEKNRLLAIGKRKRQGPLNSVVDPSELGNGSASFEPSHAVKKSGTYDVWTEGSTDVQMDEENKDVLAPHLNNHSVKKPDVPLTRADIDLPAISQPHPGTSYKPTTESRVELVMLAHEKAAEEENERTTAAASRAKMFAAQQVAASEQQDGDVYLGMKIDKGEDNPDAEEDNDDMDALPVKKPSVKKTKQQKRKAERQKEEKRMLVERAAKKRSLVDAVRTRSKAFRRMQKAKEEARLQRKIELANKLKTQGLSGHKIGKHMVPEEKIDVQLSDEVSESLRAMKVEGNLFRDRFVSLQRRAIIEPRAPVVGRKRKLRVKEIEKHAFKRFT